jgi:hypothetical protein
VDDDESRASISKRRSEIPAEGRIDPREVETSAAAVRTYDI